MSGALYSEAGESLRGLAAAVLAFDTPPTIVLAERLQATEGRCAGAKTAVRTYWTEGLRALAPESVAKVELQTDGGQTVAASGFDDQGLPGSDGADDNVLDVCVSLDAQPVRLRIPAGVLTDPAGHANAAIDVDVALGRG